MLYVCYFWNIGYLYDDIIITWKIDDGVSICLFRATNEMVEVTKHNFDDEFPLIIQRIKSSAFVAIDTEFTALTIDEQLEKSR